MPKDVRNIQVTDSGKVVDTGVTLNTEQILELIQKGESEEVQKLTGSLRGVPSNNIFLKRTEQTSPSQKDAGCVVPSPTRPYSSENLPHALRRRYA